MYRLLLGYTVACVVALLEILSIRQICLRCPAPRFRCLPHPHDPRDVTRKVSARLHLNLLPSILSSTASQEDQTVSKKTADGPIPVRWPPIPSFTMAGTRKSSRLSGQASSSPQGSQTSPQAGSKRKAQDSPSQKRGRKAQKQQTIEKTPHTDEPSK